MEIGREGKQREGHFHSRLSEVLLREVWRPLSYIDFPLVVVVYIALQRDAWQALLVGTLAGLIVDAASGRVVG